MLPINLTKAEPNDFFVMYEIADIDEPIPFVKVVGVCVLVLASHGA